VRNVRHFLSEFLNDKRVIDLPWLLRKFLVNIIIVPFRAGRSSVKYRKLWTTEGSPLLVNLEKLTAKLHDRLKDEYIVIGAMRYGNPSLEKALHDVIRELPDSVIVFPLYPHYASSTTGSVNELTMRVLVNKLALPEIKIAGQFYNHPLYLESVASCVKKYDLSAYDHILFSYHGLPLRQIRKIHPEKDCFACNCSRELPVNCNLCYRAACYETTRLLAEKLQLSPGIYSTSFQSRLSRNWLSPFTDDRLKELAESGCKKVLVVAPSFTADCLETIMEIGDEYSSHFRTYGGCQLDLVPSLNDDDKWADALIKIAGL
ncbi:MAG: ferrochelatase, partial [Bacteroidia bacterium]|nr:ferrochelatase [Bacteroidia bacterium]